MAYYTCSFSDNILNVVDLNDTSEKYVLPQKRRPGRPPVYKFDKPDSELSENERRLKGAVLKRRQRQNKSYHRKKLLRELQNKEPANDVIPRLYRLPPLMDLCPQLLSSQNDEHLKGSNAVEKQTAANLVLQPSLILSAPQNNYQTSLLTTQNRAAHLFSNGILDFP